MLVSGCSAIPADGPSARRVRSITPSDHPTPYQLIRLDAEVAAAVTRYSRTLSPSPDAAPLPPGRPLGQIGVGDTLRVTLWEPNPTSGTLFDQPGSTVTVRVEPDGTIAVPYAGRVPVAGRTPALAEAAILRAV